MSVCLEVCTHPDRYGRCHYHVFWSIDVLDEPHPWAKPWAELFSCEMEQLVYGSKVPHVTTVYSKNGKGNHFICRNGHYYCAGPKVGQLYAVGFTRGEPMNPIAAPVVIPPLTWRELYHRAQGFIGSPPRDAGPLSVASDMRPTQICRDL